ncbi:hypothetical protein [Salinifilum ghardaiensis]
MAEKRKRVLGALAASAMIVLLCGIGAAIAWPLIALRFAAVELPPSTSEQHVQRSVLSTVVCPGDSGSAVPGCRTIPSTVSGQPAVLVGPAEA